MKYAIYIKGERGTACFNALINKKMLPILCVSEKSEPHIEKLCKENGITYTAESTPKSAKHITFVKQFKLDLLVCAGYSKILPKALFSELPYGGINCHGGKLPEYRGASPIPWQIIRGETTGAAYVLRLTENIDDGPILASETYEIAPDDTARELTDKVVEIFTRLIPDTVALYFKGTPPRGQKQNEQLACHWTRRYPEDGLIEWDKLTVTQAVNLIRGLSEPYPGAFTFHNQQKLIITRARPYPYKMAGVPGRVVGKTPSGFLVLAIDGAVEILALRKNKDSINSTAYPIQYGSNLNK